MDKVWTAWIVVFAVVGWGCGSGTQPGDLAQQRERHTVTGLVDGRVLVVGGYGGQNVGAVSNEWFDMVAGWSSAPDSLSEHEGHTATLLTDGRVLVVGGGPVNEIFDPAAGTWAAAAPTSIGRVSHTATRLNDGRVLVVGGEPVDPARGSLASVEIYDPESGTWSPGAAMSTGRGGHTATLLLDGRVLVVGGAGPVPGEKPEELIAAPIPTAEIYDPATNAWSPAGSTLEPRMNHTAVLLPNGRVFVSGGSIPGEEAVLFSSETFNPTTGTWSATAPMSHARHEHTATLLDNGLVLVVGGWEEGNRALGSAETFDAATGIWNGAGELNKSRARHSAVLLADGSVLIVGGATDGGQRPRLTELYDPSSNTWEAATGSDRR